MVNLHQLFKAYYLMFNFSELNNKTRGHYDGATEEPARY